MHLARILLWVNGMAFAGTGIYAFFGTSIFANFIGFQLLSSAAIAEFIANYSGLYLFYGGYLIWCGVNSSRFSQGLVVLSFTSFGLATGRIAGMVLTANVDSMQTVFGVWEVVTGLLCILALRLLQTVADKEG